MTFMRVIQLKDVDDMILAFEVERAAIGTTMGEFSVEGAGQFTSLATIVNQPNPGPAVGLTPDPTVTIEPGRIRIATDQLDFEGMGRFELRYTPVGEDVVRLFTIEVAPDRDWMRAPMPRGPYVRKNGRWKDTSTT
jgi:hypothetical protein